MTTLPHPNNRNPMVAWALWCDGLFELLLGCLLASAPLTGLFRVLILPAPAPLIVGFGLLLLPIGVTLIVLSRRRRRREIRERGMKADAPRG
jgi:hypothetical protein